MRAPPWPRSYSSLLSQCRSHNTNVTACLTNTWGANEKQYIHQIFTFAAPNLSINGFDLDASTFPAVYLSDLDPNSSSSSSPKDPASAAGPEIQYEPFDARKRARVEELAREEEDLMREIAALKRKIPAAAARGYADGFWEGVRADEEAFERAKELAVAAAAVQHHDVGGGGGGVSSGEAEAEEGEDEDERGKRPPPTKAMLEGLGRVDRVEDVERGYVGVVETLGRLKREMPATVAKMERARVAGEYVVTER